MNIRIRKATPADLQKLQVVMALTFFNSYKGDADVMDMAIYTQHDLALDKVKAEMEYPLGHELRPCPVMYKRV